MKMYRRGAAIVSMLTTGVLVACVGSSVEGPATPVEAEGGADAVADTTTDTVMPGTDGADDGSSDDGATSAKVAGIAAGNDFTCAYRIDGTMACWGNNALGALGDGTTTSRDIAKAPTGISGGVTSLAAGEQHMCAVVSGGVKCWGYAGEQLGSQPPDTKVPSDVTGLGAGAGATALAAGASHTCAVVAGGAVKCWGRSGGTGGLGNGDVNSTSYGPVDTGLTNVTSLAASTYSTCALRNGGLICWGANVDGQLGIATPNSSPAPSPIESTLKAGVAGIAGGGAALSGNNAGRHVCAFGAGGVRCFGRNTYGQLGGNSMDNNPHPSPIAVQGLPAVKQIAANGNHTCALTTAGGVKCWGRNDKGQIGASGGSLSVVPVDVPQLTSGVAAIAVGGEHTCAILTTGKAKCWGANEKGQLGNGVTGGTNPVPSDVVGL